MQLQEMEFAGVHFISCSENAYRFMRWRDRQMDRRQTGKYGIHHREYY